MASKVDDFNNNEEIKIFQEYLRIPSVHPNIDYDPCLTFLKRQAAELDLSTKVVYPSHPKKPILIMTWKGSDDQLPTILLNSHMDVVPVFEEHWTHPPFAAEIDDKGRIYARGSQDMKCVGTQYLGAIRVLKKRGFVPKRTVHLTFVPEEEIGGVHGMRDFIHTEDFKALKIGFGLDEAVASTEEAFHLFYAERAIWHVHFKINGKPGHGLQLFKGTVGEKAHYILDKLMKYRETQVQVMEGKPPNYLANVTTVNLTRVSGGVQSNVIPPQMTLTFDMRLAIDVDHDEWIAQLNRWCEEAGGNIEIVYEVQQPKVPPTKLDEYNKYWVAFKAAIDECGEKVAPCICPGATDIRFVRSLGLPGLGFMPIKNTPILLHDHDEFLEAGMYLRGIEIYQKILEKITSLD